MARRILADPFKGPDYTEQAIRKARSVAKKIIESPEYVQNLHRRAVNGLLAPSMEALLWHYLYGKPQDHIEVAVSAKDEDLSLLSDRELQDRARDLASRTLDLPVEGKVDAEMKTDYN